MSNYSPHRRNQSPGVIITTTGGYNIDLDAEYAARKFEKRDNRFSSELNSGFKGIQNSNNRSLSREEILATLDRKFEQERSKSNEKRFMSHTGHKSIDGEGPIPRSRVPRP